MCSVSFCMNFVRFFSSFISFHRSAWKMVGQKTLTSFFSPVSSRKRRLSCSEINTNVQNSDENGISKKAKTSVDSEERLSSSENFTNETENRPESGVSCIRPSDIENRLGAIMKQTCSETNGLVVNMGASWFKVMQAEFSKSYFVQLSKFVAQERQKNTVFPPAPQVFSWTRTCDVSEIKVVILGQDPYHNVNQAHGFAFSVQKGVAPPPSLLNMYKEMESNITGFKHPGHGDLTGWARQGVLLLNAVLTVRAHNANSHKDQGWEKFTDAVIAHISNNLNNVVFILWGSYAQKKGAQINKNKHLILRGPHPSPLSAHRGFFGCQHFSKANTYLKQHRKTPINWSDL